MPTNTDDLKKARQCLRRRVRQFVIPTVLIFLLGMPPLVWLAIAYKIFFSDLFFFWIKVAGGGIFAYAFTVFGAVFFAVIFAGAFQAIHQDLQDIKRISAILKNGGNK